MQSPQPTENHARLKQYIEREAGSLAATLRFYVLRANVAWDQPLDLAALELLNDVTVEALTCAGRFDPDRGPRAWLLGIAANLIRRRQVQYANRERREPLVGDLRPTDPGDTSEEELFDQLAQMGGAGPSQALEAEERLAELLAVLPEADRQIVRLAVLHNMSGEALAHELEITPGAARVRLHRALGRLRDSHAGQPKDGKDD